MRLKVRVGLARVAARLTLQTGGFPAVHRGLRVRLRRVQLYPIIAVTVLSHLILRLSANPHP